MEIWKLLAGVITLIVLTFSTHGLSSTPDKEHWSSRNWEDEPFGAKVASEVASLIKRSKAYQFYGLMGKRSDIHQPMRTDQIRNKGEKFVGLMGRSLRGDTLPRLIPAEPSTAIGAAIESDKQTDSQEEWDKLQYY